MERLDGYRQIPMRPTLLAGVVERKITLYALYRVITIMPFTHPFICVRLRERRDGYRRTPTRPPLSAGEDTTAPSN